MKRALFLALTLCPAVASAAVDQYYNDWQVRHASSLSDLTSSQMQNGLHYGYIASIDVTSGGTKPETFVLWPSNTFSCSSPHCVNAPQGQWVDIYTQVASYITWASLPDKPATFTPSAHAPSHLLNGSDSISGLSPSQIAACAANTVIFGNGSVNACGAVTNAMLAGSIAWSKLDPATLPSLITGSLTPGAIPYASGATTLADSPFSRTGGYDVTIAGTGHIGSPFLSGAGNKIAILGSSYWDGTRWQTPAAGGANTISLVTESADGICFYFADSIGSGNRSTTNSDMDTYLRRMCVNQTSIHSNVAITIADGTQGVDKIWVSDANGKGAWTSISTLQLVKIGGDIGGTSTAPTVIAATGSSGTLPVKAANVTFDSSLTYPVITQAPTSGAAYNMKVEAQSSSSNDFFPADLILNAGSNQSGTAKGAIQFGYAGGSNGAFGTIGQTGAAFRGPITAKGTIGAYQDDPSIEYHVVSRNSGYAYPISEDVQWFRATSTTTSPVNIDITTWLGSAGIPDNHDYHAVIEVALDGYFHSTITATATWHKEGGVLTANEGLTGINGLAITMGAGASGANTMRWAITPPSSASCIWTAKLKITQTTPP